MDDDARDGAIAHERRYPMVGEEDGGRLEAGHEHGDEVVDVFASAEDGYKRHDGA